MSSNAAAGGVIPRVPSIGADVHYIAPNGGHYPAKVIRVAVEDSRTLDLVVFGLLLSEPSRYLAAVMLGDSVGSWHWPESVPPLYTV